MDTSITLERQRAQAIAEDYRNKGYEVIEWPSPQELPEFVSSYQPDLLVRKGDDSRIIEVRTRSSLREDPQITDLARLLHGKPGWTFDLVIVPEGDKLRLPESTRPLGREDILQKLGESESLLESGHVEVAFMTAWSASEAAVRLLLEEAGIAVDTLSPSYVLRQAVTEGIISRADYKSLFGAIKFRNALVHGFKAPDFNSAVVASALSTTRGLLQQAATSGN